MAPAALPRGRSNSATHRAAADVRSPISERQFARPAPEIVLEGLRKLIMSGKLASGSQLRLDALAARFGTSRIPVREALRQLAAEGIVEIIPRRGAIVATLSLDDVLEILEIRIGLECRAITLAVPKMVAPDIELATRLLDEYDSKPKPQDWSEMNRAFHMALYAPCDLARLLKMIDANLNQLSRFVRMQVSQITGKEDPQREHRQLLEACVRGDAARASNILKDHIAQTQRLLVASARLSKTAEHKRGR